MMVIMSIMGSMVLFAARGVVNSARASRTRAIIGTCDGVIQELYESYKYRPLPLAIPNLSRDAVNPNNTSQKMTASFELLAYEAARVRLNMTRDLQRLEMPDKIADVATWNSTEWTTSDPVSIKAVANRIVEDAATGRVIRKFDGSSFPRFEFPVTWAGSGKPANFVTRANSVTTSATDTWDTENEGAECLYLIMATSFASGTPAIDGIPDSNIGDTDEDGMPEILDGWGRPLGFVRWPVGYTLPTGRFDNSVPDDFDPFRSDFGYLVASEDEPYSIRPLILSSGEDEEFGVELSSSVDHSTQSWPLSSMDTGTTSKIGDENDGRSAPYQFVDPYLRHSSVSVKPGQITNAELHADDITNFSLQESQ
ncbi:type II secretory pathway pseudopilin PulG [Rhodopirellula rubra]|uniref:Type II secretory pathway pseudopilin PulG n=1 Tax=Aporhodopirellula rubra TaxID=980271 RepID=A0A7W5DU47_9BACT|nr:type II secretory pathway pseudopilin PulG [Aporhodopirellula rubra]